MTFLATLYASKHNASGAQLITLMVPWEETDKSSTLRVAYGRVLRVKVEAYDGD